MLTHSLYARLLLLDVDWIPRLIFLTLNIFVPTTETVIDTQKLRRDKKHYQCGNKAQRPGTAHRCIPKLPVEKTEL